MGSEMCIRDRFAALKKYEPRVTVKQITWRSNAEGVLRAKVKVVINET